MRTIRVDIQCYEDKCFNCVGLQHKKDKIYCLIFDVWLDTEEEGFEQIRCQQCLDAEIKEPIITTGYMQIDEEVK